MKALLRSHRRFALTLALGSVALATSSLALAGDPPRPGDVAAARALGVEGIQLADQGQCAAALEPLTRAEALYHAPTLLGRLGECQVQLGKLVSGTENLNRVVREQLPADASEAFRDAQTRARRVLAEATPRIAKLTVRVTPADAKASLELDGSSVSSVLIGVAMPVDPGKRALTVRATGFQAQAREITLAEGVSEVVNIELLPGAPDTMPLGAETSTASAGPTGERAPPSRLPAYLLIGAGGVGLGVGGVFGILTLGHAKKLDEACGPTRCPESSRQTLDAAERDGLISTVAFSAGAVSAAIGLYWLFTSSDPKPVVTTSGLRVLPQLGPTSAGLAGSF